MRIAGPCAGLLLVGALSGCVKPDIERLENQVQLLDKRVELLQQDQEKANAQLLESWKRLRAQLEENLGLMQRSTADSSTRIEDLVREMRTLSDQIEKSGFQTQRLSEQLAQMQVQTSNTGATPADPLAASEALPASEAPESSSADQSGTAAAAASPVTPETAPPTYDPGLDPELTYRAAYSDYAQGNFKLAIVNFRTYVQAFPNSAKAVLAQYFIGESFYALGQYRDAVAAFDRVITGWPGDEKVPVAYLKKGYALLSMGQKALGMGVLQELIGKHPSTHEALLAKERLAAL